MFSLHQKACEGTDCHESRSENTKTSTNFNQQNQFIRPRALSDLKQIAGSGANLRVNKVYYLVFVTLKGTTISNGFESLNKADNSWALPQTNGNIYKECYGSCHRISPIENGAPSQHWVSLSSCCSAVCQRKNAHADEKSSTLDFGDVIDRYKQVRISTTK